MKVLSLFTLMIATACCLLLVILGIVYFNTLVYNTNYIAVIILLVLSSISTIGLFIMYIKEWNNLFLK